MVRTAFVVALLGLLALGGPAPASARPAQATWWFWLSKPERHGSRKLAGDFTPVYTTYRYHSRERRGLLGFLHRKPGSGNTARRHNAKSHAAPRKGRHMTL